MATTERTPFGELLKHYRRAASLPHETLAERASLSDLERSISTTHR
jgi:hypothetical protein